ncbi:hypothetical protein V8G61_08875 [Gaetbulibacter sp. M240]|uniref:hypothetical protein n=1 Tax=Gaetbulibacter sp. M240 TaxID=3126511 RepID=UPI00374EE2FD
MLEQINLYHVIDVFKTAPSNFYSPCGRNNLLTQKEIDIRKMPGLLFLLTISEKEIVFRRFWEISRLPKEYWGRAFEVAIEFLKKNNIPEKKQVMIIDELIKEIHVLEASNGRILHNPIG